MLPNIKDRLLDDLTPTETAALRRTVRGRLDGNWDLKRPISLRWAWRHGAWRQWFKSHRVDTGTAEALGRTGEGCMPGFVRLFRVIYHMGPIKVVCG